MGAAGTQHKRHVNYHSKHVFGSHMHEPFHDHNTFGSHMHELVHEHKPGGTTPSRRTMVSGDHEKTHDGMRSGTLWVQEILPSTG